MRSGYLAKRALVLEDDKSIRLIFIHLLEISGFQIESCDDTPEALRLLTLNSYDLFLADYYVPSGTSDEAIRLAQSQHVPRIVVTSAGAMKEADMKPGCPGCYMLNKPFDLDQFFAVIGTDMPSFRENHLS